MSFQFGTKVYLEEHSFLDKDQGYLLVEGGEQRKWEMGENDIILVVREEGGSQSFILPLLQCGHVKLRDKRKPVINTRLIGSTAVDLSPRATRGALKRDIKCISFMGQVQID